MITRAGDMRLKRMRIMQTCAMQARARHERRVLGGAGVHSAAQSGTHTRMGRAQAGFTLVETMMALIILVILSGVVASGIPVASKTYSESVDAANAQAALTATASRLRDELGLAQDVLFDKTDGTVALFKVSDGYWASLENPQGADEKGLYLQSYIGVPDASQGAMPYGMTASERVPLVPDAAVAGNIRILYGGGSNKIAYDYQNGVFVISDLRVVNASDAGQVLAETGEKTNGDLKIRTALY